MVIRCCGASPDAEDAPARRRGIFLELGPRGRVERRGRNWHAAMDLGQSAVQVHPHRQRDSPVAARLVSRSGNPPFPLAKVVSTDASCYARLCVSAFPRTRLGGIARRSPFLCDEDVSGSLLIRSTDQSGSGSRAAIARQAFPSTTSISNPLRPAPADVCGL